MPGAPLRTDELLRLHAVQPHEILNSEATEALESIARLASRLFQIPITQISLMEQNGRWRQSCYGPQVPEQDQDASLCTRVLELPDGELLLEVPDVTLDDRFHHKPLVVGQPGVRYYAGALLVTKAGARLGTISLIDVQPRPPLTESERAALLDLVSLAVKELELRRAQHDLRRAQDHQQWVLAQTRTVVWELDLTTGTFSVNGDAQVLGLTTHALPTNLVEWAAFVHEEDRAATVAASADAVRDARKYRAEYRVVSSAGEVAWLLTQGHPVFDTQGKLTSFAGTTQNITELKRNEHALSESQTRLQAIIENISDPIYLKDTSGRYQLVNHAAADFLRLPPDRILGQTDDTLFDPSDSARIRCIDEEVLRSGEQRTYESNLEVNGDGRAFLVTKYPYVLHGQIQGLVGVSRDVTERRKLEEQLERQARRTLDILESVKNAFLTLDREWRFTYVNGQAERLLEASRNELLGRCLWDQYPSTQGSAFEENYRHAMNNGEPVQFEALYAPSGRWYEVHAAPSEEGLSVYLVNITERKAMEDALRHANQMLEQRVEERTRALQNAAYHDVLTGLRNRRAFDEDFEAATRHAKAARGQLHVILLDLDELKTVNDQQGHEHGDRLLQVFAAALRTTFREHDHVYRLGGDEFVVLMPGEQPDAAALRSRVEQVSVRMREEGFPTARASMGLATFPLDAGAPNDLLRLADQRMLRDKTAQRATRGFAISRRPSEPDTSATAEMMWQALRATSSLISSDNVIDEVIWKAFLQAALAAIPGAEAGTLYVRDADQLVIRAQVGFSDALLGLSQPAITSSQWHGNTEGWQQGKARMISGPEIAQRVRLINTLAGLDDHPQVYAEFGALSELRANICAPVIIGERVVAQLSLDSLSSEQAFEPHELRIAEEFAAQAAAILVVHERRASELARTREVEVLARANLALRAVQTQEDIERMLVEEAKALLGTDDVALMHYQEAEDLLKLVVPSGSYVAAAGTVVPRGRGLAWSAIEKREVLRVNHVHDDPRAYRVVHPANGALLAAPLLRDDDSPVGALLAFRETPRAFSELDARLLGALASAGVTAYERLWTSHEEQRRSEELRMLAELSEHVHLSDDVSTVALRCLSACRALLGADYATFFSPSRQVWVTDGAAPPAFTRAAEQYSQEHKDLVGALLGNQAFLATHSYAREADAHQVFVNAGVQGAAVVPVLEGGKRVGAVALLWFRSLSGLPASAAPLLTRSAELIGQTLDRQAHIRDIEATREGALLALGLSLELRDFETAGHTERVVSMAVSLGRALGLETEVLEGLRQGAYLHDIGKLAVPDRILLKPGKLDAEEWRLMQAHSAVGAEMVARIPSIHPLARQVIRHHHERWDGAGYPDSLAGEAIPVVARIFSVVDVYDALTSERPYKRAWTHEEALKEIYVQAGRQFDPRVVQAFQALLMADDSRPDFHAHSA